MAEQIMSKELQEEIDRLLKNGKQFDEDMKDLNSAKAFALEQWRNRQKGWFRDEPGRVTFEDVIKTCVEFGWNHCHMYHMQKEKQK